MSLSNYLNNQIILLVLAILVACTKSNDEAKYSNPYQLTEKQKEILTEYPKGFLRLRIEDITEGDEYEQYLKWSKRKKIKPDPIEINKLREYYVGETSRLDKIFSKECPIMSPNKGDDFDFAKTKISEGISYLFPNGPDKNQMEEIRSQSINLFIIKNSECFKEENDKMLTAQTKLKRLQTHSLVGFLSFLKESDAHSGRIKELNQLISISTKPIYENFQFGINTFRNDLVTLRSYQSPIYKTLFKDLEPKEISLMQIEEILTSLNVTIKQIKKDN